MTVTLAGAVAFVRVAVPWIDTGETESLAPCVTMVVFVPMFLQSFWVATGHAPMDGHTPMAVTFASLGFFASAWAGDRLLKSFSKVHTFLILASTSSLGLGLGWLVGYRIFNIAS
ncbi:hypothetical protein [Nostoc sp. KVJ3]|uniref:hypothetical protein n=1 Tax=Nostoc sp. KVJ3 TaxID=457945 RepID=UPI0022388EAB|nr:hypothetical protein [Nostoc sp. KVJ3]